MTLSNTGQSKGTFRLGVAIAAFLLGLVLMATGVETFCSVALIHYYRWTGARLEPWRDFQRYLAAGETRGW